MANPATPWRASASPQDLADWQARRAVVARPARPARLKGKGKGAVVARLTTPAPPVEPWQESSRPYRGEVRVIRRDPSAFGADLPLACTAIAKGYTRPDHPSVLAEASRAALYRAAARGAVVSTGGRSSRSDPIDPILASEVLADRDDARDAVRARAIGPIAIAARGQIAVDAAVADYRACLVAQHASEQLYGPSQYAIQSGGVFVRPARSSRGNLERVRLPPKESIVLTAAFDAAEKAASKASSAQEIGRTILALSRAACRAQGEVRADLERRIAALRATI